MHEMSQHSQTQHGYVQRFADTRTKKKKKSLYIVFLPCHAFKCSEQALIDCLHNNHRDDWFI